MTDFLSRFFRCTSLEYCDEFFWRTDGKYAPLSIFAACSDVFAWGCADCEDVTPENIDVLEQAIADCEALDKAGDVSAPAYAVTLFCARVRKMRPQDCFYDGKSDALSALFDACGPVRADWRTDPSNHPRKAAKAAG